MRGEGRGRARAAGVEGRMLGPAQGAVHRQRGGELRLRHASARAHPRAPPTHRPLRRRQLPHPVRGPDQGVLAEGYIDGKNDRRLDDCLRYCIVSGKKALDNVGLAKALFDAHAKVSGRR